MSQQLKPGTVYVQNYVPGKAGDLYTLDLATGRTTTVGKLVTEVYDLGFVGQSLYGLSKKDFGFRKTMKLINIDPTTGKSTTIGDTQFDVVGLAYNSATKKLYATAHQDYQIVEIDVNTGKGTPVVTLSDRDRLCGELAFDASGTAYITQIGTDLKKYLATCNFSTGQVTLIGDIGFPGLASMAFINGVLYGVTGEYEGVGGTNGQVIRIDTTTGKGTLVTTTDPAVCWAGMTVYATSQVQTTPERTPEQPSRPAKEPVQLLTISTKEHCYVINPDEMGNLQQNVASSLTLENGTFDIQITSGNYRHNQAAPGEPLVVLWIYGVDGSTFINKNTGAEVGTTWTTLNGYSDRLQLEIKNKAVLCALFFNTNSQDSSGTIKVSITSNKAAFQTQTLSIDSQKNCYLLKEIQLRSLQKWGRNFIELDPGSYRLKIRESNASYWSNNQKFQLEPWALLKLKVGKVVPKSTGIEVQETWCSLNGLKDEFIFDVKEKTTLSGFFFDTYKDDNEGQITVVVESASNSSNLGNSLTKEGSFSMTNDGNTIKKKTTVSSISSSTSFSGTSDGTRSNEEISFTFNFDDSQLETAWQEIAAKVEAALTVTGQQDATIEARRWDQLDTLLLTGYRTQAKELAMQVARLELMMNTFRQQLEGNLQLTFQKWSTYFDGRLQSLIGQQITDVTQGTINVALEQLKLEILNQATQLVQTEIGKSVTPQIDSLRIEINKNLETQLNNSRLEFNKSIESQISNSRSEFNQSIEAKINSIKSEINKTTEAQINNIKTEINTTFDTKIDASKTAIATTIGAQFNEAKTDLNKSITTQINQAKITNIDVKNVVTNEIADTIRNDLQKDIYTKMSDIRANVSSLEKNVNTKLDALRVDFRGEVVSTILEQISQLIEEKTKLEIAKVDFNTYITEIDVRATKYLERISQLEINLISRINQGDAHLYNWVLEQLITLKGCITDRQVLVEQLETFSNELKTKLDTTPCVNPGTFKPWTPLSAEPEALPGVNSPQLPAGA